MSGAAAAGLLDSWRVLVARKPPKGVRSDRVHANQGSQPPPTHSLSVYPWQRKRQRKSFTICAEIITDKALNIKLHTYLFWPAPGSSVRRTSTSHRRVLFARTMSLSVAATVCEHAMSSPAIQILLPLRLRLRTQGLRDSGLMVSGLPTTDHRLPTTDCATPVFTLWLF